MTDARQSAWFVLVVTTWAAHARADAPELRDAGITAVERSHARSAASPDPALTHRADGSYTYDGLGINATISKRGDVTFVDKRLSDPALRFQPPLEPPATLNAPRRGAHVHFALTAGASFDLTGPHSAERRWFLARTEVLRDLLVQNAHTRKLDELMVALGDASSS